MAFNGDASVDAIETAFVSRWGGSVPRLLGFRVVKSVNAGSLCTRSAVRCRKSTREIHYHPAQISLTTRPDCFIGGIVRLFRLINAAFYLWQELTILPDVLNALIRMRNLILQTASDGV